MPDVRLASLYRYFIWSNLHRLDFEALLTEKKPPEGPVILVDKPVIHMLYWYASLYCVIEGWRAERLRDAAVTALLRSKRKVDLLRDLRNHVFHFEPQWLSPKIDAFLAEPGTAMWARDLHGALGRFFRLHFPLSSPSPPTPDSSKDPAA